MSNTGDQLVPWAVARASCVGVGAVLRSSDSDLARAKLKGKGGTLPDPALPLTPPVTAQLINSSNGVCFESTFADLRINDGTRVKARVRP